MRELSWTAIILGVLIGALLAAANAFVGLKVGMTISASIPAAVMSLLILRTLLKRGTLLESNMVQTIGSAGESVAAGMIFTIPALFMMGENPAYLEMLIWAGIGGLLGVCFMVPLRQVLIVKEHGVLPYPEGVACAEVLESGERGGNGAKSVIWGSIVGAFYYLINGLGFFKETGVISLKQVRTEIQVDSSPALLGVGYILGAKISAYMLGGAVLSWFVLIPAVGFFGEGTTEAIFPSTTQLISDMSPSDVHKFYVRYVGAGAVAVGGLISLFKSFPTILASMWHLLSGMFRRGSGPTPRTEKDFPFPLLALVVGGLAYAMWTVDAIKLDHIGVVAVVIFTFFFVTVSSRLVGLVGSSSNPVSGMTIATLLGTALVYKYFVMGDAVDMPEAELTAMKVACLSIGAIVCIAITIGGDTSQDLKTGYLVGATPYKQQIGEMIGVLSSVVVIAGLLILLNNTFGYGEPTATQPHPLPAFQASIMKIIVEGVLGGNVPWTLLMMGGAAAVIIEMLGLPALPFAVGMYLPLGLSTPIMVGGIVRWLIDRKREKQTDNDPGVLTASGLVAGMGLMGVTFAGVLALISWWWANPVWTNPFAAGGPAEEAITYSHFVPWVWNSIDMLPNRWGLGERWWDALPMVPFFGMVVWLWLCARKRPPIVLPPTSPITTDPPAPILPDGPGVDVTPSTPSSPSPGDGGLTEDAPLPVDLVEDSPGSDEPTSSIESPRPQVQGPKYLAGVDPQPKTDWSAVSPADEVPTGAAPVGDAPLPPSAASVPPDPDRLDAGSADAIDFDVAPTNDSSPAGSGAAGIAPTNADELGYGVQSDESLGDDPSSDDSHDARPLDVDSIADISTHTDPMSGGIFPSVSGEDVAESDTGETPELGDLGLDDNARGSDPYQTPPDDTPRNPLG